MWASAHKTPPPFKKLVTSFSFKLSKALCYNLNHKIKVGNGNDKRY